MAVEEDGDVTYGQRLHPVLHFFTPIVSVAAVWAAKEGLTRGYAKFSGREVPTPSDPQTSWARAIAWTVVTTSTAATIEVSLRRVANEREVIKVFQRGRHRVAAPAGSLPTS